MAGGGTRGGDRVLESRHLIGLFLGVVLLRRFLHARLRDGPNAIRGSVHAAESPAPAPRRPSKPKSAASEAALYDAGCGYANGIFTQRRQNHLEPPTKPTPAPPPIVSGIAAPAIR